MLSALKKLPAALIASLALAACAAAPANRLHHGVLHLTGSAPFVRAVLDDDEGRRWPLEGIDKAQALALQNRRVEIEAGPAGSKEPISGQPVLMVRHIRPLD
jgi:hypothetical protein